jgi:large repetitive protein
MNPRPTAIVLSLLLPAVLHAASDVTLSTAATSGGAFSATNPKVFTPVDAAAFVQNSGIQSDLNAGTGVTIDTASAAAGNGDIVLSSALSKNSGANPGALVLNAVRDISIGSTITASGGHVPLTLNAGRKISITSGITTNGGAVVLNPAEELVLGSNITAGAGAVTLQNGLLRASSASPTITTSTMTIASGASLRMPGSISGSLNVAGSVSAATPGATGSLQVSGALALQAGSTTTVEIGGTSMGSSYDKITANGAVTIAGGLQVELVNNFHDTIATSNSFTILQGQSISGTFTGLPNGSRYTLANDRGSFRINYNATTVTLDDWQPVVTTLAWDPGTAEAGTAVFSNSNTRGGRHFFKVTTQSSDIGGWRSRLTVTSGEAALYLSKTALPTTGSSTFSSVQTGSDGLVLRDDQFAANEEWTLMVFATEGAQWSIVSGKPYVHDLGALPFTDSNGNGLYDIGEAVAPQNAPAAPMPPEGIRFYKTVISNGTPAWSLWLGGSNKDIALRSNKLPFHNTSSNYTRKQAGHMLMVPPVLGAGTSTWYSSIVAPQGEEIGLDSRIQAVSDLAYNGTVSNVVVNAAPYRVYRVQVPVDQIAWDINAVAVAGNPDIAVRKGSVPAEFDNDAFSASAGSATEGITLVPNYLTDGTWYITTWGDAPYTFTLKNGDPVITPLSFTDTKVNDQPARSGWRFYALTDVPSQVGALGWELQLSNQVPGTQLALRRNKVPGRWQKRDGGTSSVTDTNATYMDEATTNGFIQRVNHQADVWYVGVFTPQQPLGAFTLDVHPINPPSVAVESNTLVASIPALKWRYYRMDVPAGVQGWDLRLKDVTGGNVALVVRRDLLPSGTNTHNGATGGWNPAAEVAWPSGYQWAGGVDWTGRNYDTPSNPRRNMDDRIIAAGGRPLVPGTYYIGIYNDGADPMVSNSSGQSATVTLESRRIGTGGAIPIQDFAYNPGSSFNVTNLQAREAAYYKVTIPPNTPSWEFTLTPTAGEMMMAARRDTIPDALAITSGNIQALPPTDTREAKFQKTGAERYLLLPDNNQTSITPGDYYFAFVSEGVNPPANTVIGTGSSSGTFTNIGPLAVPDLGAASAAGISQPVSLASAQAKAWQFTVPAGTASLEVRLDNRVGNPQMVLISGNRVPQVDTSAYDLWTGGGQTSVTTGAVGRQTDDDLLTIANPPAGVYTVAVRAEEIAGNWPDASASLAIVANAPVPLGFNAATATVTGQAATAWRYFQATVPDGVLGWDLRLTNILSGNPQMVVRRDQLPASVGTNNGGVSSWGPSSDTSWPSGYQWSGGVDWTGRTYDVSSSPRRAVGDRLVAASGRPLVPGTYIVGIYNTGADPITGVANTPAAYTIESRGIGAGQAIPVGDVDFAAGSSVAVTNLAPREAAYFKTTVPPNTPRWEFTLSPTAGEAMVAVRRNAIPDFNTVYNGNMQDPSASRQMEMQRTGGERYSLLPENNQDFITPGDYYIAVISEGVNPPSSTVLGTGNSSATFTNLGSPAVQDLGNVTAGGINQAVALVGAQVKAYRFTVPAGTASLEVRLDNRTGNPQMAFMSGLRLPQPDSSAYDYGTGGGQTSTLSGGLARQTSGTLVTIPNPPAGVYSLTVRADEGTGGWPDATANLVISANAPQDVPVGGGTVAVANHGSTSWKYFQVTIPAGIAGWDLRLKDITGGNPQMVVRRDFLPSGTSTVSNAGTSWTPSSSTNWPTGNQWAASTDWTGRQYDTTASNRRVVDDRLVAAMGRPLEPGTYYIGVYNDGSDPVTGLTGQPCSYTLESRYIGDGQAIPIGTLGFAAGSNATISNLVPREAAYFKVTVPENTPSWEFTFTPSVGETLVAARRGFIPDFSVGTSGDLQDDVARQTKVQKAGAERYYLLPLNNQNAILAGDYYLAVVSEGVNPSSNVAGNATSSGTLASNGSPAITNLGTASLAPLTQAVSLAGAQTKGYQFTVPEGIVSLEVQLNNRTGNPRMALISGNRLPYPDSSVNEFATSGGQSSTPTGGVARTIADSLITVPNPPAGTYSLTVRADDLSSVYPDATADLVVVAKPRQALNFAASQNGNGLSHSDTRQLADAQKQFYEVAVPTTLAGQPVLGWIVKVNHAQGDTTLRIYREWGKPADGVSITGNTGLIVAPFLAPGETWFIEVTATGLTNYTLTSQPVVLERPAWTMPAGHNFTFGDSGNDSAGNPLPGDRGTDIGQDDWHVYAIDVPSNNSGLLRTELRAISGNPNLYIREDGVPTTDHDSNGGVSGGDALVHRKMEDTGSEYGNWVPFDGRTERVLRPGRWYLGVKATGGSNARYRLITSTGQVTDLDLASASVSNQTLVGRDWRYYRFTVPADAPATWNLGFTQQVGDVVMWIRDTVPSGQNSLTGTSNIESWSADSKNQGPYDSAGHDAPGTYPFNTAPLRPGHTYYAGFRANTDATFSVTSSISGSAPVATPVAFYNGVIDTSVPASGNVLYKIVAPADATRLKWTATHSASVQLRVEQGTIPGLSGNQHALTSGANSSLNQALTPTGWPWQPGQTYYLRIVNSGASPASVLVNISGLNAGTEDEDADGLPDAWERTYFNNSTSTYNGTHDPDGDGVINSVEFTDGTIPNDINSAKYFLTVNANFGSVTKSPNLPKYDRGTNVTLTATPNAGLIFTGWSVGATGAVNPLQFPITANKNITANFGVSLPVALDSALAFNAGGDGNWMGQVVTSLDGEDAAQSAPIGHSQEAWMETTVNGPGEMAFWWKVSSQVGDYLEFYVDGVLKAGRITGEVDWTAKSYAIDPGQHVARWRYVKNGSGTAGSDSAWVDAVQWMPSGSYNQWVSDHFTEQEIGDPAIVGQDADPDGDGMANLIEYAFGTEPREVSSDRDLARVKPEVVQVVGEKRLRLRFTLPEFIPADVLYQIEVSDDLKVWTVVAEQTGAVGWSGGASSTIAPAVDGRREHVITNATGGARFGRVKVSVP